MPAELPAEMRLRLRSARQNDKATGLTIQTMDSADTRRPRIARLQQARQQVDQRRGQMSPGTRAELRQLLLVSHGRQSGRLLDYDDVAIDMANADAAIVGRGLVYVSRSLRASERETRSRMYGQALSGSDARLRAARTTVEVDAALSSEPADPVSGEAPMGFQEIRDGAADVVTADDKHASVHRAWS